MHMHAMGIPKLVWNSHVQTHVHVLALKHMKSPTCACAHTLTDTHTCACAHSCTLLQYFGGLDKEVSFSY